MYEKAVSFETMDYQLVFWGYTFAIKKLTWFAQVSGRNAKKISSTLFSSPPGNPRILDV